ncbi:hypothetical protein [Streptomyces sp. NPDC005525]|uniref:hypothetical protein n=1 Tax=Streptomyces sp. NPDC005525 TaxID=3364720 RepID=UPI00367D215C
MTTTATALPPPPRANTGHPAGLTPPTSGNAVACDLLGVVRIPATELDLAVRAGVDPALLDTFLPAAGGPRPAAGARHIRLGRGPAYYRPRTALPSWAALGEALDRLDHRAPGQAPVLRHALLDNLHNLAAAGAYTLWHSLTDRPSLTDDPRPGALERLLETATSTAALHGHRTARPFTPCPGDVALLRAHEAGWRTFRELDNPVKIGNELSFLAEHVLAPRPDITAVLAPLYGSLSLALTARTVLPALLGRPIDVHLVRLGFHDQGNVAYLGADGTIHHRATAPLTYRDRLTAATQDATVLVIDDNVGYGGTLRAARALVEQLGGRAVTRSVESAWTLYHRSGRHDIADAADLPSLRPNLHHSIQTRLTGHLLRGDTGAYLSDGALRAAGTLHRQMAASFDLAVSTGTWTSAQLAAMRAELAHAASWTEPPVPRPAALAAA